MARIAMTRGAPRTIRVDKFISKAHDRVCENGVTLDFISTSPEANQLASLRATAAKLLKSARTFFEKNSVESVLAANLEGS